jgi:hypothetical protein
MNSMCREAQIHNHRSNDFGPSRNTNFEIERLIVENVGRQQSVSRSWLCDIWCYDEQVPLIEQPESGEKAKNETHARVFQLHIESCTLHQKLQHSGSIP